MKRPFPLQSLLLIFIPLTIAIILIVLWGLNDHQRSMRQAMLQRNLQTALLAANHLEAAAPRLNSYPISQQRHLLETELLAPLVENETTLILVVNRAGEAIFASEALSHETAFQSHPGVAEALAGQAGVIEASFDGELHAITYVPVAALDWALILEEQWAGLLDVRQNAPLLIPLLFVPIIGVALFYLWATQQWVLKPLQTVSKLAQAIGKGEFSQSLEPIHGVTELVDLHVKLQEMGVQLQKAQDKLRGYAQAIQQGQEEERLRVSQELHDDTIQSLVHLDQQVQLIQARLSREQKSGETIDQLNGVRGEAALISQNIRRLIHDLRPTYLNELGLVPAVKRHVEELRQRYPQQFVFEVNGRSPRLDPTVELALYRVMQESVSNAIKHANASRITVQLGYESNRAVLTVKDNGSGFDPYLVGGMGYGLLNLQERARAIGATFEIVANGGGSRVQVSVMHNGR